MPPTEQSSAAPTAQLFATTQWNTVLMAGGDSSPTARLALEQLCATYWYPLYAYVRRQGHSTEDAQDLTQEFFARLLDRKYLRLADRNRGRFRTFLLTSLQHFLVNEWAKTQTLKRGGAHRIIPFDEFEAETRYRDEPADDLSPDRVFEKRWAAGLLEQALSGLRDEYAAAGKRDLFEGLKTLVWGEKNLASYQEMGAQLGLSEGAVKVAVHRLRQRYRERLRAQVAQTVDSPDDIDEELRYLILVVSS